MVNWQPIAAVLGVLTVAFAASTGYFATNPTVTTTTFTSTKNATVTQSVTQSTTTTASFTTTSTVTSTATLKPSMYVALLVGANEIPSVTTTASGIATVIIAPDGKTFTFSVTVYNISNVTLSHIHVGPPGQNNPVGVNFFIGPVKAGTFTGVLAQGSYNSTGYETPGLNANGFVAQKVKGASSRTGDSKSLSDADISILAVSLDLRMSRAGQDVILVTDDFAVRNVAEAMGINLSETSIRGGGKTITWVTYCKGCGKEYLDHKGTVCDVCGTKLSRKPKSGTPDQPRPPRPDTGSSIASYRLP